MLLFHAMSSPISNATKQILVIEDDEMVLNMLESMLQQAGYRVASATNGVDGLKRCRRDPADLVITDIMMPQKDGVETIRELRKEFPDVKIIAVTGFRGRFNRLAAAENVGAHRTLLKPFTQAELLDLVEDLLPG